MACVQIEDDENSEKSNSSLDLDEKPQVCANCSYGLNSSKLFYKIYLEPSFRGVDSKSSLIPVTVSRALDTIFKFNYIDKFQSKFQSNVDKSLINIDNDQQEQVGVCGLCADRLTSLYACFNDFNASRSFDSFVSQKIGKLDSVIENTEINLQKLHSLSNTTRNVKTITRQSQSQSVVNKVKIDTKKVCPKKLTVNLVRLKGEEIEEATTNKVIPSPSPSTSGVIKYEPELILMDDTNLMNIQIKQEPQEMDQTFIPDDMEDLEEDELELEPNVQGCAVYSDEDEDEKKKSESSSLDHLILKEIEYDPDIRQPTKIQIRNTRSRCTVSKLESLNCSLCDEDETFATPKDCYLHLCSHIKKPKSRLGKFTIVNWHCPLCSKKFCSQTSVYTHLRLHVNYKPFPCKIHGCTKSFTNPSACAIHSRTNHGPPKIKMLSRYQRKPPKTQVFHKCDECDQKFKYKFQLMVHIRRRHSNERLYNCTLCQKSFVELCNLIQHQQSLRHQQLDQIQQAKQTGLPVRIGTELEFNSIGNDPIISAQSQSQPQPLIEIARAPPKHLQFQKKQTCPVCRKRWRNLPLHLVLTHKMPSKKSLKGKFACTKCDKSFSTSHGLKIHNAFHTRQKFICAVCRKSFVLMNELKEHLGHVHGRGSEKQESESNIHF